MSNDIPFTDSPRFQAAIRSFDQQNTRDPNEANMGGPPEARELAHSRRLSEWVLRLKPDAGEALRLAARCQHLCRWEIPRDRYPMTRAGYLQWRTELKKFHARKSGEILHECGYPDHVIERVQALNLKSQFPDDPDSRVLEDALCLFFLENQLEELALRTEDEKLINALRKTWKKMTPQARDLAVNLPLGDRSKSLVERALQNS